MSLASSIAGRTRVGASGFSSRIHMGVGRGQPEQDLGAAPHRARQRRASELLRERPVPRQVVVQALGAQQAEVVAVGVRVSRGLAREPGVRALEGQARLGEERLERGGRGEAV